MLLRSAVSMIRSAKLEGENRLSLLCSFEPLHLKTFLQAMLVERFGERAPEVLTFGFDQLAAGLTRTETELRVHPSVLFLSWEDLHPSLTWRARGGFHTCTPADLATSGGALEARLASWLEARAGADTFLVLPPTEWLPPLDALPGGGLGARTLAAQRVMAVIAETCASHGARVIGCAGRELNYRDLLSAGCPLTLDEGSRLARRIVDLAFRANERKKAIVLDLDGTLWNGVIGEDGRDHISARDDGKGFPHFVFQHVLLRLKCEGIMLAICSKNNPGDVLPFFDALDMPLRLQDFAVVQCNWQSKSDNIREIARKLNIGTSALVFVDDNPAELARVAAELPEVSRLVTPQQASDWPALFAALHEATWTWRVSDEDRVRTESIRASAGALDGAVGFTDSSGDTALAPLRDLGLELTINPDAFADPRSLELVNKTNQFNLTGVRMSSAEWLTHQASAGAICISARLRDNFGSFGTIFVLVGMISEDGLLTITQMVMSCRAFGRTVEWAVLLYLLESRAVVTIEGEFVPTGKNDPTRAFLRDLGVAGTDSRLRWRVESSASAEVARRHVEQSGMHVDVALSAR